MIAPDVELGPCEQRVDAHVPAVRNVGERVTPELRRLLAHVPTAVERTRAHDPLLRARRLLVAADPDEHRAVILSGEQRAQPFGLAGRRARLRRQRGITRVLGRALLHAQVEVPLVRDAVAKRIHLGQLHAGVELHDGHRHVAEKRLPHQPQQRGAVLAHRPQHAARRKEAVRVANDRDRVAFELVEVLDHSIRPDIAWLFDGMRIRPGRGGPRRGTVGMGPD